MKSEIRNTKYEGNPNFEIQKNFDIRNSILLRISIFVFLLSSFIIPSIVTAQTLTSDNGSVNINSSTFRFVVCDGPTIPPNLTGKIEGLVPTGADFVKKYGHEPPYVPCDFNAIMKTAQHIINIAMVAGVIVAVIGFLMMGFLFMSGKQQNISRAKTIFPKLFWGFVLMVSAWFIVYQLLSWLTDNKGFKTLLGG